MADKREWMDALSDPRDGSCAQSEEEAFKGCRERLARAEAEFQQVAQRFEQAYSLSVVAALPVIEAYRLIATHGLGFTATVEEWLLRGYHLPQALALAAQGRGTEMVAMQRLAAERDFPLTRLASSLKPAACRGCQHYYGRIDGMHRLVCAMHPYGPDADRCEDWKAFDRS